MTITTDNMPLALIPTKGTPTQKNPIPPKYRPLALRVIQGDASPKEAIKLGCMDCHCFGDDANGDTSLTREVAQCSSRSCPLPAYRPFKDHHDANPFVGDDDPGDIPDRHLKVWWKARQGKVSPRVANRLFCLRCQGWDDKAADECKGCFRHLYRANPRGRQKGEEVTEAATSAA